MRFPSFSKIKMSYYRSDVGHLPFCCTIIYLLTVNKDDKTNEMVLHAR